MHGKSGMGMSGAMPLSPQTVLAFAAAYDTTFDPWEIDLLVDADMVLISAANKKE